MSGYLAVEPDAAAPLRLLCFHHAGGAASAFSHWQRALGPDVAVLPVQLPGREGRIKQPRLREMDRLVDELVDQLCPWLSRPYVLYGHSMGAIVAYALTRRLLSRGGFLPQRLLVGAHPAPHLPAGHARALRMPDRELARWMVDIGGMSPELLNYPDWLAAATSLLRDDLAVCTSSWPRDGDPLPCPIDVFTGALDPLVSTQDAEQWRAHTAAHATVHVVPGGHFFLREPLFLSRLRDVVGSAVPRAARL